VAATLRKGAGAARSMLPAQLGAPAAGEQPTCKVAGPWAWNPLLYGVSQLNPAQKPVPTDTLYCAAGGKMMVSADATEAPSRSTADATIPQSWYRKCMEILLSFECSAILFGLGRRLRSHSSPGLLVRPHLYLRRRSEKVV
jgi:hypothetical protein